MARKSKKSSSSSSVPKSPNKRGKSKKTSVEKVSIIIPTRRSKRLIEKDLEPGQKSPGRRCSPQHRVSFPSRPLLKRQGKRDRDIKQLGGLRPGFYSADDLQSFLEQRPSASTRSSPVQGENHDENYDSSQQEERVPSPTFPIQLLAAKSPPSKKTVVWSEKLEW